MKKISLDGTWDFVVDMNPKYHSEKRLGSTPGYERPDWDRRHWQQVSIPGVWNKYAERLDIYEGVCWFVREFQIDDLPAACSARIRFGAVNYLCRVFLNGSEVGQHEGGYTEFAVDVTGQLTNGVNHLSVSVDNRATKTKLPPVLGYFNYGGIHRNVTLEIASDAYLDNTIVQASPDASGGSLSVAGNVGKCRPGLAVQLLCEGASSTACLPPDGSYSLSMALPNVKNWSPESPNLYPLEVMLMEGDSVLDSHSEYCGFRSIAVRDGSVYLNDRKIAFKGICYVYDSPLYGLYPNPDAITEDIDLLRELGVNAIRCHYPLSREFYEACDCAGIMVWVETPVYCLHPEDSDTGTPFAESSWQELARGMYREMIAAARNHPSIVIYGLGNECNTANPEAAEFFRTMAAFVRGLDNSRLLSYAALYGIIGDVADVVDILGINSYWGWYDKVFGGKGVSPETENAPKGASVRAEPIDLSPMRNMLDQALERKQMALLLTEFGADSIPGYLSGSRDLWSEDYHADLLNEILDLAAEYPWICGTFPFCFSDYRDPSKPVNGYWDEMNYKGVVSYNRRRKRAFHALAERYGRVSQTE